MKYIKLFENFKPHDPYELMIIPPNKQAEMIVREIKKDKPNLNLVSDLITLGANLNWQDKDNDDSTPLHMAAWCGNEKISRMLIDAGANVNMQDKDGRTPLHIATYYGEIEIARMLIDSGADVNVQDEDGSTPLHRAAYLTGLPNRFEIEQIPNRLEIARMLIKAGARKDIPDNKGRHPYDLARTQELENILKP